MPVNRIYGMLNYKYLLTRFQILEEMNNLQEVLMAKFATKLAARKNAPTAMSTIPLNTRRCDGSGMP